MRFTTVTAAALAGLIALSGCGAEAPGADTVEADSSPSTQAPTVGEAGDTAEEQTPTSEPTPESSAESTPEPSAVTAAFESNLENSDGYTGVLGGTVTIDPFVVETANSKPGLAELFRPAASSDLTFANKNDGRAAPLPRLLMATAYYPADSGVCGAYGTFEPEELRGDRGEDMPSYQREQSYRSNEEYCFVDILYLEPSDQAQDMMVPAGGSVQYGVEGGELEKELEVAARTVGSMIEVPEAEADALAEKLNNPLGVVLMSVGIMDSDDVSYMAEKDVSDASEDYISDFSCPALPTWVENGNGGEAFFPEEEDTTVVGATGPIC